jgi:hypothetical protein
MPGKAVAAALILLSVTGGGVAGRPPSPDAAREARADGPMQIYLLMGQSNMSGRGDMAGLTAADRAPDPTIRLYGNDGVWRAALDPLDDAAGQIDPVSADPHTAAVGPGLFFARALPRAPGSRIGLVPCAKGGSKIAAWKPSPARDTLYGSCLARAREAATRGRIAGILWYQGESDTGTRAAADRWPRDFITMIAALRHDLAAPRLPLVIVGIADRPPTEEPGKRPYWAQVQAAQASLRLPCAQTVSAAGLPLEPDGLHLTTSGQRRLGAALARAMARLRKAARCR